MTRSTFPTSNSGRDDCSLVARRQERFARVQRLSAGEQIHSLPRVACDKPFVFRGSFATRAIARGIPPLVHHRLSIAEKGVSRHLTPPSLTPHSLTHRALCLRRSLELCAFIVCDCASTPLQDNQMAPRRSARASLPATDGTSQPAPFCDRHCSYFADARSLLPYLV